MEQGMHRGAHGHVPHGSQSHGQHGAHVHIHRSATEHIRYNKSRKEHTFVIFLCIAVVVGAAVGIGYIVLRSGQKPGKPQGVDGISATESPRAPAAAPAAASPATAKTNPSAGPADTGVTPPGPATKIEPISFKEEIETKTGGSGR